MIAFWFIAYLMNLASLAISVQRGNWFFSCMAAAVMVLCVVRMCREFDR